MLVHRLGQTLEQLGLLMLETLDLVGDFADGRVHRHDFVLLRLL